MSNVVRAGQDHGLRLRAFTRPSVLSPGSVGTLIVEAEIPEGCHIESHEPLEPFLIPTVLTIDGGTRDVDVRSVGYPAPATRRLGWSPAELRVYQGTVRFEAVVAIAWDARPGRRMLSAELSYQACTESACLLPTSRTVEIALDVGIAGR